MKIQEFLRALVEYVGKPPLVQATESRNELKEEIGFHLNASARDHRDSGCSSHESQQIAIERFGDIDRVLEECDAASHSRQMIWHRLHQFVTISLGGAILFLCFRFQQIPPPESPASSNRSTATGYAIIENSGDVTGSVTGGQGEIIDSAHIMLVVKTWPPNGYRQQSYMATTRADGTFVFENVYSPKYEHKIQLTAVANDRVLTSEYTKVKTGNLQPFNLQLKTATHFVLRFETETGDPIEGVSAFPSVRQDDAGFQHIVFFSSAEPIIQTSDMTGNIPMPYFSPGESATVYVRFPNHDWEERELIVPHDNQLVLRPTSATLPDPNKL